MESKKSPYYTYHYNREERLSMPGARPPSVDKGKGVFKKNRALIIILIDILIIVIVFLLYQFFFNSPDNIAYMSGYSVVLRQSPLDDRIIFSIIIKREKENAYFGVANIRVALGENEIYLTRQLPSFGEEFIEITDTFYYDNQEEELAPGKEEQESGTGQPEKLIAEIEIDNEVRILKP
jgi:hypothetical protein